jgi:hypothetical protein
MSTANTAALKAEGHTFDKEARRAILAQAAEVRSMERDWVALLRAAMTPSTVDLDDYASVTFKAGAVVAALDAVRADAQRAGRALPWRECLPCCIRFSAEGALVAYLEAWARAEEASF